MKIGQIMSHQYDISSGSSTNLLTTSKNIKQLEEIVEKLNKKYGRGGNDFTLNFSLKIIDTEKIPTSLNREEINALWK